MLCACVAATQHGHEPMSYPGAMEWNSSIGGRCEAVGVLCVPSDRVAIAIAIAIARVSPVVTLPACQHVWLWW